MKHIKKLNQPSTQKPDQTENVLIGFGCVPTGVDRKPTKKNITKLANE